MAKPKGGSVPEKNVPGGNHSNVDQHKRMAMGQKVTGQAMKKGGKVEKEEKRGMARGGRGC